MPNIGSLLKQEIVRLSRKEARTQVEATKRASTQYRKHIAALKRQLTALERQVTMLGRRAVGKAAEPADDSATTKVRFVAKGLRSQRTRLGLSASDYGRLVGVSAQSIYNWEQGHAIPRAEQLKSIATIRGIGKREALKRLESSSGNGAKSRRQ